MKKNGGFSSAVRDMFARNGVGTEDFIYTVIGDMNPDDGFSDCWIAFDQKGIYIAWGTEALEKSKGFGHGRAPVGSRVTLEGLITHKAEDFDSLSIEQYAMTGMLMGEKNGEKYPLCPYTVGCRARFDQLAQAFNCMKKGEDFRELEKTFKDAPVCPICGMRYPDPDRPICPKCRSNGSTVKRLLTFAKDYKVKIFIVIAAILLGTGISLVTPQISTAYLYDHVLNADNAEPVSKLIISLGLVVLGIIGVKIVSLLFSMANAYLMASITPWIVYDIKMKIFASMQRMGMGFYTGKQTGSLMERVERDSNNIYWFMVDGLPFACTNCVLLVGVVMILFVMNWKLALFALLSVPVIMGMFIAFDQVWHRIHHRVWSMNSKLSSTVSDNINGARIIKSFSKESEESARFGGFSRRLMGYQIQAADMDVTLYPMIDLFSFLITALILAVGGTFVIKGQMTLGNLMAFTVYVNMLAGPLDFLSWISNWWARTVDSAQRMFEVIDAKPDIIEDPDAVPLADTAATVELRELEFEYEPSRPVIKKMSLTIPAGHMLGVVGKTGAGKTTIANLIARLYDPKKGAVLIDGVDIRHYKLDSLRKNVGMVSQDIFLFMGTVADNIRYAKPDASMEEVIAAAKAASAHDFIMKLPDAYQTRVGAGGQDLSGGERQRISIARTIIQNPKILLLDEATAAMDTETEKNIQEALTKLQKGRTTLSIAHRLSTLRDADELAVIEEGKVVEYGSFEELMRKKGEYYKLYKIQSDALKYVGVGED